MSRHRSFGLPQRISKVPCSWTFQSLLKPCADVCVGVSLIFVLLCVRASRYITYQIMRLNCSLRIVKSPEAARGSAASGVTTLDDVKHAHFEKKRQL